MGDWRSREQRAIVYVTRRQTFLLLERAKPRRDASRRGLALWAIAGWFRLPTVARGATPAAIGRRGVPTQINVPAVCNIVTKP